MTVSEARRTLVNAAARGELTVKEIGEMLAQILNAMTKEKQDDLEN